MIAWIWRTFVEGHDDISSNRSLDVDHILRGKNMPASVKMTLESNSFFSYFSIRGERKYLVAAAIGQDRLIPIHELMQAACAREFVYAWPQVKMISVA